MNWKQKKLKKTMEWLKKADDAFFEDSDSPRPNQVVEK